MDDERLIELITKRVRAKLSAGGHGVGYHQTSSTPHQKASLETHSPEELKFLVMKIVAIAVIAACVSFVDWQAEQLIQSASIGFWFTGYWSTRQRFGGHDRPYAP